MKGGNDHAAPIKTGSPVTRARMGASCKDRSGAGRSDTPSDGLEITGGCTSAGRNPTRPAEVGAVGTSFVLIDEVCPFECPLRRADIPGRSPPSVAADRSGNALAACVSSRRRGCPQEGNGGALCQTTPRLPCGHPWQNESPPWYRGKPPARGCV